LLGKHERWLELVLIDRFSLRVDDLADQVRFVEQSFIGDRRIGVRHLLDVNSFIQAADYTCLRRIILLRNRVDSHLHRVIPCFVDADDIKEQFDRRNVVRRIERFAGRDQAMIFIVPVVGKMHAFLTVWQNDRRIVDHACRLNGTHF